VDHPTQAVIVPGRLDDAARQAYAVAFGARCDTSGGLGTMEDELTGASLFDVQVAGVTVLRYALRTIQREKGAETFIVAAAGGMPGVDMTATITPFIETQCANVDRLTINTRRPGLVKKLKAQGWSLDSYVMRKKLK